MAATKKILAVSSSGGHWIQLLTLKEDIFDRCNTIYVGTNDGMKTAIEENCCFHTVSDCNLREIPKVIICSFQIAAIVLKERPNFVISTGAAPGFLAIFFGRITGAKTIWIDSMANTKKLSISGKFAKYFSNICLTQWLTVAEKCDGKKNPMYKGRLI